jgi:hypothetical protein
MQMTTEEEMATGIDDSQTKTKLVLVSKSQS